MAHGRVLSNILLTPVITAGAYAAGDVIGSLMSTNTDPTPSVGSKVRFGSGRITKAVLYDKALQIASHAVEVYLFRETPSASTITDDATFALHDDDLTKLMGAPMRFSVAGGARFGESTLNQVATIRDLDDDYIVNGDDIFAVFRAAEGSTPTFVSTSDLALRLYFSEDN